MNVQHTPGPWQICRPSYATYPHITSEAREHVAVATTEADARLIAAAPELLEALDDLVAEYESIVHNEYDGTTRLAELLAKASKARIAIAKASGQTC